MSPIPPHTHPPFCCDYTPRLQGGDALAEQPRRPHPAVTGQQDPGISWPDGLPEPNPCGNASCPTSLTGRMENMANRRGLTHAGAREARRAPRAGVPGTHALPHEDAGCCHGAGVLVHVAAPEPMSLELPPTLLGQLGRRGAFSLSVLTEGCKAQKPRARTPGTHCGSGLPANPSWSGPLQGLGGTD